MLQVHNIEVREMTVAASIEHIARNIEAGQSTAWDADCLKSIGVPLSSEEEFRISHGLTTVDDSEAVWDSAFFAGVI